MNLIYSLSFSLIALNLNFTLHSNGGIPFRCKIYIIWRHIEPFTCWTIAPCPSNHSLEMRTPPRMSDELRRQFRPSSHALRDVKLPNRFSAWTHYIGLSVNCLHVSLQAPHFSQIMLYDFAVVRSRILSVENFWTTQIPSNWRRSWVQQY